MMIRTLQSLTLTTCATLLMLGGTAVAQPRIQVFDDAPSLEQLRSIMIPESRPSAGRSIVLQRPDSTVRTSMIQPASAPAPMQATMPAQPANALPAQAEETTPSPVFHSVSPTRPAVSPTRPAEAQARVVGFRINFAFNSAELPTSSNEMIDRLATLLKETPDLRIRIEGHTDAVGTVDYNQELSERRAASVAAYLAEHGINPNRLEMVGKGMSEPLMTNGLDSRNRRVQFVRVS